jgi:hypothetical protein
MEMSPSTILDVGAGHGKWGVLCQEYLAYWKNIEVDVDGVEIYPGYSSQLHSIYRYMYYKNIIDMLDKVGMYDLVLAIDVIEHLEKADGLALLGIVRNHYVVTTPNYWSEQGECFGNPHEKHVSKWTREDFVHSELIEDVTGRSHILGWK